MAGLVMCVFALVVFYGLAVLYRKSGEEDENSLEGSAKRERGRLLRLLSRVRKANAASEDVKPGKGAEEDTDTVDASLSSKATKMTAEDYSAADAIFSSTVSVERCGGQDARRIRIQCPGVAEADVTIKIIFNGVEVHIARKAKALTWIRPFVFPVEDGHFVFKDEQTRLDRGVLEIVCIAKEEKPRIFRFPEHFDMAYDDFEHSNR